MSWQSRDLQFGCILLAFVWCKVPISVLDHTTSIICLYEQSILLLTVLLEIRFIHWLNHHHIIIFHLLDFLVPQLHIQLSSVESLVAFTHNDGVGE